LSAAHAVEVSESGFSSHVGVVELLTVVAEPNEPPRGSVLEF
jgi:hypothetical protein